MANRQVGVVLACLWLGGCVVGYPPKPFSSEVPPTEAIAQVDEIPSRPVWVRFLNGKTERTAQLGTWLRVGESLRTEGTATVQIVLNSGAIARISGNSSLVLNSLLQANSGYFLVSAMQEDGRQGQQDTQVQTPFGVISTGNGAFYLEIPQATNQKHRILALHGNIKVKLSRTGKEIALQKGEELLIASDGSAGNPQRPTQGELESHFAKSDLFFGFSTKFVGQSFWEKQLKVARRAPEQVKFRPAPPNPEPIYAPPPQPSTAVRNVPTPRRQPEPTVAPPAPPVSPEPVVAEPAPAIAPPPPEPPPIIEAPAPEPPPISE